MSDETDLEIPPLPRFTPLTPVEIAEKRERLAEEMRAADERRERELATGMDISLAGLLKRIQADATRRQALPCYELAQRGDVERAAEACEAVKAHCGDRCPQRWRTPDLCPREELRAQAVAVDARLVAGRVPPGTATKPIAGLIRQWARREVSLVPTEALREVREWMPTRSWILLLSGAAGIGKTLAAAYAVGRLGGLFLDATEIARLDSARTWDKRRVGDLLVEAETAPLLVLDDAGAEHNGEGGYAVNRVRELLAVVYRAGRRAIVTSNLSVGAFCDRYDERLRDRIADGGVPVELNGASLRRGA